MQTTQTTMKISEVAKELEVSPYRLRGWIEKGLIETTQGNGNVKLISNEELPKIKRIVEILDSSSKRISLDEVKTILEQEQYEFVQAATIEDDTSSKVEAVIQTQPENNSSTSSEMNKEEISFENNSSSLPTTRIRNANKKRKKRLTKKFAKKMKAAQ